ncbi:SMI1/KNR4 family protein [Streptomyces sp. SPB074]|uniref:SMI1/KNR4 family protein n=1 Tax=Streptomyces sp. (strain SPB074) TaxID=465543 RepID=UPI0001D1DBBF|nr:SMI1/KNR4 family protein [Streptomyces sp. SPB074]EFG65536.1 conserved hypothetical protein [Streptomyces sp. SPB074]
MTPPAAPATPLTDFATWEPLSRLLWERCAGTGGEGPFERSGQLSRGAWSLGPGGSDFSRELRAVEPVLAALAASATAEVAFVARLTASGAVTLRLFLPSPAVEPGIASAHPGALLLVEGAVPEPWRRLPEPVPGAVASPSADAARLTRTLRARLPGATGADAGALAAAEARLGRPLPPELRALYTVVRGEWRDVADDPEAAERVHEAVSCELLPLSEVYVADAASRPCPWVFGAMEAVLTPPDAAVQGLPGSPGWLVFGDNGGGDRLAVDLTPGPGGHVGQVVLIGHEESVGAELLAGSLTSLVLRAGEEEEEDAGPRAGQVECPEVAYVNARGVPSVAAAAHPALEVLSLGRWESPPTSLAPVLNLPRLRSLSAGPGTLADPLEIGRLDGLEFLRLPPAEWRALLAADAVPRGLLAAAIEPGRADSPLATVALANEILGSRGRPPIVEQVVSGTLA